MQHNDAVKEKNKREKENAEKFCPLINSTCNKNCVCFKPAIINSEIRKSEKIYYVQFGYCDNAMFHYD